jgi:hypothetical protein
LANASPTRVTLPDRRLRPDARHHQGILHENLSRNPSV